MSDELTFKVKKYLHFSEKIEYKDVPWVNRYISDPKNIVEHRFYPFIRRVVKQRKFRRMKEGNTATERKLRKANMKARPISYANHLDRCIYSHYASKLECSYELALKNEPLIDDAVIAYRSKKHSDKNLSNAALAKEVFEIIRGFPAQSFRVTAMDVSSFFDELSHKKIKLSWKDLMGFETGMPDDHYAVFKNITKYSYVDFHEVFKAFSDHHKKNNPKYLRSSKVLSFSPSVNEFRKMIIDKGLVRKPNGRDQKKGIPQGSPISPVLANIYMLDFDRKMSNLAHRLGGYYRRYSDDILFIYHIKDHEEIYSSAIEQIGSGHCLLAINESKNQEYLVKRITKDTLSFEEYDQQHWTISKGFEYLGFLFNGKAVRIRSSSLSKYYRKIKRGVRRSAYYASTTGMRNGQNYIYKNMIYKKFTHIGANRRLRHRRIEIGNTGRYNMVKTKVMDWGNYLSYIKMSSRVFNGVDGKAIKKQVKNHMKKVKNEIREQSIKRRLDNVL